MARNIDEIIYKIRQMISEGKVQQVEMILHELHPADATDLFLSLAEDEQITLFKLLDTDVAVAVLNEIDSERATTLLTIGIKPKQASEILEEMYSDDAADLLGEMPEKEKNQFLGLMGIEEAEDVQELLEYGEETAGGLMTTEYVAIRRDITVEEAIQVVREIAQEAETVYYVYVLDQKNRLVGVNSLRDLILASPHSLIEDIMHQNIKSVNVKMDQEEVARMVAKYDFLAVPVVDDQGEFLGIITVDDVIDVIHDEATEDLYLLVGASEIDESESTFQKVNSSIRARLPWLFVTMFGGLLAGQVLRGFEDQLQAVVALAFFIPLLTGMGGNVGTQSSTITVRGLATGQIDAKKVANIIFRESAVGFSIGLIIGAIVAIVAMIWQNQQPMLGVVVGLAMWANIVTAATMGTLVPLIFKRIGIDPAVASAPFITTTIDVTGLLIYSFLATSMLNLLV